MTLNKGPNHSLVRRSPSAAVGRVAKDHLMCLSKKAMIFSGCLPK